MAILNLTGAEQKVLNAIRQYPGNIQNQICQRSGVPWPTTTKSIKELLEKQLIVEKTVEAAKNKKKKETVFYCISDIGYYMGISVGKSDTRLCFLDFSFNFVPIQTVLGMLKPDSEYRQKFGDPASFVSVPSADGVDVIWHFKTPTKTLQAFKNMLDDICGFALEINENAPILCVSFAFGDHVDNANTELVEFNIVDGLHRKNVGPYVLFSSDRLRSLEEKQIGICFEQNAKAAAVAEQHIGCLAGNPKKNGLVLYLGRGLGAAFIQDGQLYRGSTNAAGSAFGHQKVEYAEDNPNKPAEEPCACGGSGCLEQKMRALFGGTQIVKENSGAELAALLNQKENADAKTNLVKYLARAVANICELFEYEFIVFSGKLSDIYQQCIGSDFQTKMLEYSPINLQMLPSEFAENAAAIGAAICGFNR